MVNYLDVLFLGMKIIGILLIIIGLVGVSIIDKKESKNKKYMKLVAQNITLENVRNSDYWNLIAILVWNHYSEKEEQDESKIKIEEYWFGKFPGGGSYSNKWNDPNYSEEGAVRTLSAIVITFEREDYTTYIYLYVDGNINCFGIYSDKSVMKSPHYIGLGRNLDITNWLMKNNFVGVAIV